METYGDVRVHAILTILLTNFSNSLNLIRPLSEEQIVYCAYELMTTANEDFLSIEDLTIFFQGAIAGKYGKILDRMDQQTLFELLENYRQARHIAYIREKEEQHVQVKGLGPVDRACEDQNEIKDLFHQANISYIQSQKNDEK